MLAGRDLFGKRFQLFNRAQGPPGCIEQTDDAGEHENSDEHHGLAIRHRYFFIQGAQRKPDNGKTLGALVCFYRSDRIDAVGGKMVSPWAGCADLADAKIIPGYLCPRRHEHASGIIVDDRKLDVRLLHDRLDLLLQPLDIHEEQSHFRVIGHVLGQNTATIGILLFQVLIGGILYHKDQRDRKKQDEKRTEDE